MAKLVLTLNGKVINQFFIDKPVTTIGRGGDNDIVIDDPLLSRAQARIVRLGDDDIVEDLQSSNGTSVNGKPLSRQILQHRDVIALGSHQLCYMSSRAASDVDFDRTMIIRAPVPLEVAGSEAGAPGDAAIVGIPAARSAKPKFAAGSVTVLASPEKRLTHETVPLARVVTTFGTPGVALVVLTRRPNGVFLSHVEGARRPRVNRQTVGQAPLALHDGDLIEAAGYRLKFSSD